MKTTKLALKPYLDAVAAHCDTLSQEQLKQVILGLAKNAPAPERATFLAAVQSCLQEHGKTRKQKSPSISAWLSEIDALKEAIEARTRAIEDGSYWDAPEDWDDDYSYDDDDDYGPDALSEDQVHELTSFFGKAEQLFLNDRLDEARKVYAALFEIIEIFRKDAHLLGEEVDLREARARYSRCVYETASEEERLVAFARAMDLDWCRPFGENQHRYDESRPMLQDVIDAKTGELKDLDAFFPAWREVLEEKWTLNRPAVLLLEAACRLSGVEGVSALAREWKERQPMGYLFWLDMLKKKADSKGIIEVSVEALTVLTQSPVRQNVAQFLIDAAEAAGDSVKILDGKREHFFAQTDDASLLAWVAEAVKQNNRPGELDRAIQYLQPDKFPTRKGLFIKCLLMAGRLEDAFQFVKSEKSVGWSFDNSPGLVFGAALSTICRHSEKAVTVKEFLSACAGETSIYSYRNAEGNEKTKAFYTEIISGLRENEPTAQKRHEYLSWAEEIGKRRIDEIVSNQHRSAYARAAQVLCALAETYLVRNRDDHALLLLRDFYREKYNRHTAFKKEVKKVMQASPLLKSLTL